jgi:hypothetical protein
MHNESNLFTPVLGTVTKSLHKFVNSKYCEIYSCLILFIYLVEENQFTVIILELGRFHKRVGIKVHNDILPHLYSLQLL